MITDPELDHHVRIVNVGAELGKQNGNFAENPYKHQRIFKRHT